MKGIASFLTGKKGNDGDKGKGKGKAAVEKDKVSDEDLNPKLKLIVNNETGASEGYMEKKNSKGRLHIYAYVDLLI